jgi:hypothetical protein
LTNFGALVGKETREDRLYMQIMIGIVMRTKSKELGKYVCRVSWTAIAAVVSPVATSQVAW